MALRKSSSAVMYMAGKMTYNNTYDRTYGGKLREVVKLKFLSNG